MILRNVLLLACLLGACDVGRPLVADDAKGAASQVACNDTPPDCALEELSPDEPPSFQGSTQLAPCAGIERDGATFVGLVLESCTLSLAPTERELILEDPDLRNVVIRSQGKLSLRIVGGDLNRVVTLGGSDDEGFRGRLTVTHSRLVSADLRVNRLGVGSQAFSHCGLWGATDGGDEAGAQPTVGVRPARALVRR
jgi:hypothetical protein